MTGAGLAARRGRKARRRARADPGSSRQHRLSQGTPASNTRLPWGKTFSRAQPGLRSSGQHRSRPGYEGGAGAWSQGNRALGPPGRGGERPPGPAGEGPAPGRPAGRPPHLPRRPEGAGAARAGVGRAGVAARRYRPLAAVTAPGEVPPGRPGPSAPRGRRGRGGEWGGRGCPAPRCPALSRPRPAPRPHRAPHPESRRRRLLRGCRFPARDGGR